MPGQPTKRLVLISITALGVFALAQVARLLSERSTAAEVARLLLKKLGVGDESSDLPLSAPDGSKTSPDEVDRIKEFLSAFALEGPSFRMGHITDAAELGVLSVPQFWLVDRARVVRSTIDRQAPTLPNEWRATLRRRGGMWRIATFSRAM